MLRQIEQRVAHRLKRVGLPAKVCRARFRQRFGKALGSDDVLQVTKRPKQDSALENALGTPTAAATGFSGYPRYARDYDDDESLTRVICSGQRAHILEGRLRHEVAEDEIDDDDANRIHNAIDRLEDRQRHECAEGDSRAIGDIAMRYDRIADWIDSEAHRSW